MQTARDLADTEPHGSQGPPIVLCRAVLTRPSPQTLRFVRATFTLFVIGIGFPWRTFDLTATLGVVAWGLIAGWLVTFALARRRVLTTTLLICFAAGYSPFLGDALAEGLLLAGIGVGSEWVLEALVGLVLFLVAVVLVSSAIGARMDSRREHLPRPAQHRGVGWDVGFIGFLLATAVAAWSTGAWTYWGGDAGATTGVIRLELAYPSALVAIVAHAALTPAGTGLFASRRSLRWAIGGLVLLLLFILQSRRFMIGAGTLAMVAWLLSEQGIRMPVRKVALRLVMVMSIVVFVALASSSWRQLVGSDTLSVSERVEQSLVTGIDQEGLTALQERFTYLWFDGATHEAATNHGASIDIFSLFESDFVRAVPRLFIPNKDDVAAVTCETSLVGFGLPDDLPCTPLSEGFLAFGFWGVLLAGLVWGTLLGLADIAVARGPGAARTFAVLGAIPVLTIEAGFFGWIDGLRGGIIGLVFIASIAVVTELLLGRRSRAPRRI